MPRRGIWAAVVVYIVVFMSATLAIALFQEDMNWGWWWVVPIGVFFVVATIGFRVLVQRSHEAAERADREADEAEAAEAARAAERGAGHGSA